jgi:hypothetical protein
MCALEQIVNAQLKFQEDLGKGAGSFTSAEEQMRYIRDTCLSLNVEVAEFLQEMPWKPWCPLSGQDYDKHAAANEVADIVIFALNLWIHLGVYTPGQCTAELIRRITHKQNKNTARLKSGRNRRN